jgi:hypothetical protein
MPEKSSRWYWFRFIYGKKIIIAEGGSILFDSKEGEGSTFGFVFAKQKLKITKDDNLKVKSI